MRIAHAFRAFRPTSQLLETGIPSSELESI